LSYDICGDFVYCNIINGFIAIVIIQDQSWMEFCNSDTIAALNMIVLKRTVNQQNSKKRPSESSGRISRNSQHFITGNFEQIEDTVVSVEGGHSLSIDSRNLAHALPIYASGKAFISRALDAMLLQVQPQYG
jgi:hypothetical protein